MIHSLKGLVAAKENGYAVIEMGGIGFKVFAAERTLRELATGSEASLLCHLNVKEDALDLYGFSSPEELRFFELLIGVSGVGPKSALAILSVADINDLFASIEKGRPDLLTSASGIGRKTAERIIVELRGKVFAAESVSVVKRLEGDGDLIETLVSLGYRRDAAKEVVNQIEPEVSGLEARLKAALKILGSYK